MKYLKNSNMDNTLQAICIKMRANNRAEQNGRLYAFTLQPDPYFRHMLSCFLTVFALINYFFLLYPTHLSVLSLSLSHTHAHTHRPPDSRLSPSLFLIDSVRFSG